MLNRVVLTGRLTKDPELRYTNSGTAVATFTLAVDRQFKNQNNEREADFIQCVVWRKSAENFANFTHKGSLVGVDGRVSTRNYENNQGQRVYVTEVTVDNFALLESRNQSQGNGNQNNPAQFQNNAPQSNLNEQVGKNAFPQQNGTQSQNNGFNNQIQNQAQSNQNPPFDNGQPRQHQQPQNNNQPQGNTNIDDVPF